MSLAGEYLSDRARRDRCYCDRVNFRLSFLPQGAIMAWQSIRISRFGGPEVLELVQQTGVPEPGPGEVRIKVLAAGTGFTDSFIRRGRYPDFKGPLPFVPGYELVGIVEKAGPGVAAAHEGELVADLCVVGGYAQHAIRPADWLVRVPDGVDPTEAVCIPLAYLTAFQMLDSLSAHGAGGDDPGRRGFGHGRHGAARSRAAFRPRGDRDLLGREPRRGPALRRDGDRLSRRRFRRGGAAAHFRARRGRRLRRDRRRAFRSFLRLPGQRRPAGRLRIADDGGRGRKPHVRRPRPRAPQAVGRSELPFRDRSAVWYSITARRKTHPEEFKDDMAALFRLLRDGAIHPVVVERLPLASAREVHVRIDAGGLGGKIVLLPWAA